MPGAAAIAPTLPISPRPRKSYAEIEAEPTAASTCSISTPGSAASLRCAAITEEAWDHVHAINLKGCVFALQKAVRLMGRGGSVVVTGSIGAHGALEGNGAYAAAKAGLYMAMKVFAKELVGEGIRTQRGQPGPIDTPLLHRNPGMSDADVAGSRK